MPWGGPERAADGSYRLGTRLRALGAAAPCPRGRLTTAPPALRVRAAGPAEAHQEYRLGELSLTAPAFRSGLAVAAVSVTAPATAPPGRPAPAVRQAAVAVSRAPGDRETGHHRPRTARKQSVAPVTLMRGT